MEVLTIRGWTAGWPRLSCKCGRRICDARTVAEASLHLPRVALKILCVFIPFSREYWLMGFTQAPCTPVSPPSRHPHLSFAPSFQRCSMARPTRHPPLTRPPPKASSRLNESASLTAYPDSRPFYPNVYNPPIPHLHSVLPQVHNSATSSAATYPTFVDDGEGMSPLSVLQIHTTAYPNEGGKQGLVVALDESRMCVDDAAVDDSTQSQSQPKLTPPGELPNSNTAEVIQRPASAPPVFPPSGPESGQHDPGEVFVDDMDGLRDDRVGYVHVILPRARLSRLLAWHDSFFPFTSGRRKHHNPLPFAMFIHCWFVLAVPDVALCCHRYGLGCGGRAYGSTTPLSFFTY